MPDDLQHLRATLAELRRQLEASHTLDADARAMMRQVTTDLEQVLARSDEEGQPPAGEHAQRGSLVRRLNDAVRGFESTHPNLSGAVGSVIDALSRMGI
jgi:hypothetical protein